MPLQTACTVRSRDSPAHPAQPQPCSSSAPRDLLGETHQRIRGHEHSEDSKGCELESSTSLRQVLSWI